MELFYGTLSGEGLMTLDSEEASHCTRVMRHRAGESINVIDGSGTMYVCELLEAGPKGAGAKVLEAVPGFGSHPYRLTMAVCPTKNPDRYEWFAEKVTEIGVDDIAPVIGDRSERRVLKTARLERIVLSAAKQSLKGAVPRVLEPVSVSELLQGAPAEALRLICHCAEGKRVGIAEALEMPGPADKRNIFILIGPEGDFSDKELELAERLGWIPASLGDSRLRTETAAVVAAAAVYLKNPEEPV
ncbi:MAG: 16S rRNA (uracil(1498)-N(3))-methyltransferase [Bacteroidales bacterium]|nr:16S rRNA (uracil(1498)-N(3))-methyltransferase [Bacteroidales bacterium]